MTTLAKDLAKPGMIQRRMERVVSTGVMTAGDAIVFGVASLFGALPDVDGGSAGVNVPLYPDEPATWCSRCNQPFWSARCPTCGK